jgi:UDP-N-acetylglucosamine enolpyruvyl transferase
MLYCTHINKKEANTMQNKITFNCRTTGATKTVVCTAQQHYIATLLANIAEDFAEYDELTDAQINECVDSMYKKLAWWDTNELEIA